MGKYQVVTYRTRQQELLQLLRETEYGFTTSTCVDFDGVSRADFDRALRDFLHNIHRPGYLRESSTRPLTMNTLHSSIKMYTMIDKEVRYYGLFTLARSQRRVDKSSNPRTFISHRQSPDSDQAAPDDRETQKIWRGFLIHELFCIMFGIPEISAAASNETHSNALERQDIWRFIRKISAPVREELICVQQYVRDQYDLAFNAVVNSFELAVGKMGRRASGPSMSSERSTTPVIELTSRDCPQPARYLFQPIDFYATCWTDHMAMLGVSFLHEFLSWDSTTRLDFIRATHPFLRSFSMFTFNRLFMNEFYERDVAGIHSPLLRPGFECLATRRLRAVGWIFWENPDRLASMNLVQGSVNATYWSRDGILTRLIPRVPSVFVEKSLEPQDWEYIIQEFGTPSCEDQLNNIRSLFKSIGTLHCANFAEIVSTSRQQDIEGAAEAKDNDE